MASQAIREASHQMDRNVQAIVREFNGVRTGKASPAILDTVTVEAYESQMPLTQLANVSAPEPQLLLVQPYDPQIAGSISKAIQSSDLGLNPSVDGGVIRVSIPPLTEERRRDLVKVLHRMAEEGKIAVRHARHGAKAAIEHACKDGEIGEDEMRRQIDELQTVTDAHITSLDDLLKKKEAEVMEV